MFIIESKSKTVYPSTTQLRSNTNTQWNNSLRLYPSLTDALSSKPHPLNIVNIYDNMIENKIVSDLLSRKLNQKFGAHWHLLNDYSNIDFEDKFECIPYIDEFLYYFGNELKNHPLRLREQVNEVTLWAGPLGKDI